MSLLQRPQSLLPMTVKMMMYHVPDCVTLHEKKKSDFEMQLMGSNQLLWNREIIQVNLF